jgi:hypothetical protein
MTESKDDGMHLLVANLSARPQSVEIGQFNAHEARIRCLDEETASLAIIDPQQFRGSHETRAVSDGRLTFELSPYAVFHVDVGSG